MAEMALSMRDTVPAPPPSGSARRNVLIFAHECAPFNRNESTIGAQRPAQFAKWLPQFGWRAIVLCCDVAMRGRGWTARDAASVSAILRDADATSSVIIPTPSLPWDGALDRAWRFASSRGARAKAIVRKPLTLAKFFTGDFSQSWQPCAREAAALVANAVNIDACIGEHSPDAGIHLARWFAERYQVPWIADFRDPMLFGFGQRVRPVLEPFARRMLSTATHVVNVTPRFVQLDEELFRRPTSLITNGFDPDQFAEPEPPRSRNELRIVYTGSVWLPSSLRIFLEGLAELRRRVGSNRFHHIRLVYRGGSAGLVAEFAKDVGVADVLDCAGHVPHAEAVSLVRSAHLLLVLSTSRRANSDPYWSNGVYPGKTFEYIGSRRPILCVPGDAGSLDELLRNTEAGRSLGTPEGIAADLDVSLAEWEGTGDVPSCDNNALIAPYSRRAGAQVLAAILDQITSASRVSARPC